MFQSLLGFLVKPVIYIFTNDFPEDLDMGPCGTGQR
jgi:hypothetical protein